MCKDSRNILNVKPCSSSAVATLAPSPVSTNRTISKTCENFTSSFVLPSNVPINVGDFRKVMHEATKKAVHLVDWLEVTCEAQPDCWFFDLQAGQSYFSPVANFGLEIAEYGTRFYKNRGDLYYCGEKIGSLQWGNRIGKPTRRVVLKVENSQLYYVKDLASWFQDMLEKIGVRYHHTSRLDLAIDGLDLSPLLQSYFSGSLTKKGTGEIVGRYDNKGQRWTSFSMGNRKYRFLRYYDKTKEISRKETKQYIQEFHEKNGLSGQVHRLEIELKHSYLKTLAGFDLWSALSGDVLSIWQTVCKNWFEFVVPDDTNISRCTVAFRFEDVAGKIVAAMQRVYVKCKEGVHSAKVALKSLFRAGSFRGARLVRSSMALLLSEYPLKDWLSGRVPKWIEELENEAKVKNRTLDMSLFYNLS